MDKIIIEDLVSCEENTSVLLGVVSPPVSIVVCKVDIVISVYRVSDVMDQAGVRLSNVVSSVTSVVVSSVEYLV